MKAANLFVMLTAVCCQVIAQDTLTLFDPITYAQSTYYMDFDQSRIAKANDVTESRNGKECVVLTLGLMPMFHADGKSNDKVMTPEQATAALSKGIGLLTYDTCTEAGGYQLREYSVVLSYGNADDVIFNKPDVEALRKDQSALNRLMHHAVRVAITEINVMGGDGTAVTLPDVLIQLGV